MLLRHIATRTLVSALYSSQTQSITPMPKTSIAALWKLLIYWICLMLMQGSVVSWRLPFREVANLKAIYGYRVANPNRIRARYPRTPSSTIPYHECIQFYLEWASDTIDALFAARTLQFERWFIAEKSHHHQEFRERTCGLFNGTAVALLRYTNLFRLHVNDSSRLKSTAPPSTT